MNCQALKKHHCLPANQKALRDQTDSLSTLLATNLKSIVLRDKGGKSISVNSVLSNFCSRLESHIHNKPCLNAYSAGKIEIHKILDITFKPMTLKLSFKLFRDS